MAEHIIPVPPDGVFQWVLRREFDTAFHRLRFWWNDRVEAWYLNIANGENVVQVYGIRLGTGTDKLRAFKARDVPQGTLNVVDSTDTGTQPTLENFGRTVLLKYIDAPEETTTLVAREQPVNLPAPLPPEGVALHAEEHEDGGEDPLELDKIPTGAAPPLNSVLTYTGGNTASWQLPTVPAHESQHRLTGSDSIIVETLKTGESDTTKVLNPDGSGGLDLNNPLIDLPTITIHTHIADLSTTSYQVIEFTAVEETPDATYFTQPLDENINIETAGRYLIFGRASMGQDSPIADDRTLNNIKVFRNGSETGIDGLTGAQSSMSHSGNSFNLGDMHVSGEMRLAVDDVMTLRFKHDAVSDEGGVLILNSASFTLIFLGP